MILIPCESAMSVICKVKIPPQITIFRRSGFLCFPTLFLPFSWSRIMEAALGIINESFDSILGANSGGSSEERNLKR